MAALNAVAPRITDRLCEPCREHFAAVRGHLDAIGIAYRIEAGLVRGLDYYTRTAFEYYRRGAEGQQQALGGGGRYDGLVELLGGSPHPASASRSGSTGSSSCSREAGVHAAAEPGVLAVVVGADPAATAARLRVATDLRSAGLAVRAELSARKLGRQLEAAAREGAHFAVILGDELEAGHVQLRDLRAASQKAVALEGLAALLKRKSRERLED